MIPRITHIATVRGLPVEEKAIQTFHPSLSSARDLADKWLAANAAMYSGCFVEIAEIKEEIVERVEPPKAEEQTAQ